MCNASVADNIYTSTNESNCVALGGFVNVVDNTEQRIQRRHTL